MLRNAGWGGGSCGWLSPGPHCSASPPSWPVLHWMPIPPKRCAGSTQSSHGDRERATDTHTHTHVVPSVPATQNPHAFDLLLPSPPEEGNLVPLRSLNKHWHDNHLLRPVVEDGIPSVKRRPRGHRWEDGGMCRRLTCCLWARDGVGGPVRHGLALTWPS